MSEPTPPPLRDQEEIQEVHDFLSALLDLRAQGYKMSNELAKAIDAARSTLCWVLQDCAQKNFADNLEKLREAARKDGIRLTRYTSHAE